MKYFKFIISGLFIVMLLSAKVYATPANNEQQQELATLISKFNKAVVDKDATLFIDNMPTRLIHEMALRMNATEASLRDNLKTQIERQFTLTKDGIYQLNDQEIQFAETKDGQFYALIPTHIETTDHIVNSMTLAIYEGGGWHLIFGGMHAVKNPIFLEIYPSFQNINFPTEKIFKKSAATDKPENNSKAD